MALRGLHEYPYSFVVDIKESRQVEELSLAVVLEENSPGEKPISSALLHRQLLMLAWNHIDLGGFVQRRVAGKYERIRKKRHSK